MLKNSYPHLQKEAIMNKVIISKVENYRWNDAQKFELEFAQKSVNSGDDYNFWWYSAFDKYLSIQNHLLPNVLEVGCGPHTNIRLILPLINYKKIWLEDPLINSYKKLRKKKRNFLSFIFNSKTAVLELIEKKDAIPLTEPLEELSLDSGSMDLCVCINVLDHVRDAEICFQQIHRVLKPKGVLIIGQDMSNSEDFERCPESWTDIGHPIKLDKHYLDKETLGYSILFKKILSREKGRNPKCHYGTYLFIGVKE